MPGPRFESWSGRTWDHHTAVKRYLQTVHLPGFSCSSETDQHQFGPLAGDRTRLETLQEGVGRLEALRRDFSRRCFQRRTVR